MLNSLLNVVAIMVTLPILFLTGLMTVISITVFDTEGSSRNPATQLFFWSIATCPLVCLFLLWQAADALLHQQQLNLWLFLLPGLNAVGFAVAWYWLKWFHDFQFSGRSKRDSSG